ncbi:MAG: hypothetical protein HC860_00430 [Alkalinema sp. RU_4_3]|nr:hypothetical protein [Alkalinema sp. RU_4_3]
MRDTLELKILRMPRLIEGSHLPELQRNLEQWIQPHSGVMLDFTQTETTDPTIAHILLLGWDLAAERQACLSWMGESGSIAEMLGELGLTKPSHDPSSLKRYQTATVAPSQELIQSRIA